MPFCCGCLWVSVFRIGSIWWVPLGKEFYGKEFYGSTTLFFFWGSSSFFFWSLIENESILKFTQVRFSIIINEVGSEELRLGILKVLICISFQA